MALIINLNHGMIQRKITIDTSLTPQQECVKVNINDQSAL